MGRACRGSVSWEGSHRVLLLRQRLRLPAGETGSQRLLGTGCEFPQERQLPVSHGPGCDGKWLLDNRLSDGGGFSSHIRTLRRL